MDQATQDAVKLILDQDPRRREDSAKPLLLNNKGLTLSRVLTIGKGAYNTEWIEYNGEKIPLRLLSIEEEDKIKYETHRDMKSEQGIYAMLKDDPAVFERLYLCKSLSLATTPNPDSAVVPYLTEKDIKALPSPSFAGLVWHYQRLEKDYNPRVGEISDDETNFLISELLDSKKKSLFMDGLSFLQMRNVLSKLLDIVKELGASTSMYFSLKDMEKQKEVTTQKA